MTFRLALLLYRNRYIASSWTTEAEGYSMTRLNKVQIEWKSKSAMLEKQIPMDERNAVGWSMKFWKSKILFWWDSDRSSTIEISGKLTLHFQNLDIINRDLVLPQRESSTVANYQNFENGMLNFAEVRNCMYKWRVLLTKKVRIVFSLSKSIIRHLVTF